MKRLQIALITISFAAAMSASASLTYSGSALSSLDYSPGGATAQYVPGSPDVAQLYTADLSVNGPSPAVFIQIPTAMTLSSFVGSYVTSSGTTVDPYWVLYLTDDTGYTSPIVSTYGGSLDSSSLIHVGDLTQGSIKLADLCSQIDPISNVSYGQETIAWAGLEIGDGGSGAGTANIESITISSVPEPTTMIAGALLLLPFGASTFRILRKRAA